MALTLVAAIPLTAGAMDAGQLRDYIEAFDPGPGSTGKLTAFTITGRSRVIVSGTVTGATNQLELNINAGVTVYWGADYEGSVEESGGMVYLNGSGGTLVVNGGSIVQNGSSEAIYNYGGPIEVIIDGGLVSSVNHTTIYLNGGEGNNLTINGGTVLNSVLEINAFVAAINARNVTVNGGSVVSTGKSYAIVSYGDLVIDGGTVIAMNRNRNAIDGSDAITVTVSGGFVFGYGTAISGEDSNTLIFRYSDASAPVIGGDAVVCAWDKESGLTEYAEGTTDDLVVAPSGASVTWGTSGSQFGVNYANGSNTGFFQVSGVHVNAMVNVAPTLTGPTAMTLAEGYEACSTDAYTIGGTQPIVSVSGNGAITWNDSAKRLNIAAGLPAGTYPVVLTVTNGIPPDATLTFTLTVEAANVAPTLTGPTTMTLAAGYAATSTGAFTVTGTPDPDVTISSGNAAITWNDSAKRLNIAAGLPAGTYPVVLTASNGTDPDATLTFTLTVTPGGPTPTPLPFPFTDVPDTAWYRDAVEDAWRMGLIDGKTPTLYMPKDNLTYAEAVKLAACMHQLNTAGAVTLANATGGNPWYMTYVDYAKDNGIIDHDYEWGAPATRAGYIEIFANALPDEELPPMNAVSNGAIPDVPMTHPQAAAIYKLYRAGILTGVDAAHNCNPDANIMRSEVATILVRMMDPTKRVSFSID